MTVLPEELRLQPPPRDSSACRLMPNIRRRLRSDDAENDDKLHSIMDDNYKFHPESDGKNHLIREDSFFI